MNEKYTSIGGRPTRQNTRKMRSGDPDSEGSQRSRYLWAD
ncbi:SET domain protein [Aspergillus luchuensis]|uniref:SET domain protein n=1 Tax=Aspergillus kawachii TaxID=1069201 RepID=A0A146F1D0_ASPKA|nr:SET domain protein [Aspergillus luchuensis]